MGDHLDPERGEPLHQDPPHPAGGGEHKRALPGLEPRAAVDQGLRGQALEQRRRGEIVADRAGHRHQPIGGDILPARIAARLGDRIGDPLTDREPRDAATERLDHTSRLDPERSRQRLRIEAGAMIGVDEVDPDRAVPHPRHAGCDRP